MATTFKHYSSKSKAKRALRDTYGIELDQTIELLLTQDDSKWGFHLIDGVPGAPYADQLGEARTVEAAALPTEADVQALATQTDDAAHEQRAEELQAEEELVNSPSSAAFGNFALAQLTAPSNAPAAEPVRTATAQRVPGLKIEKDRSERNGVKERSKGGLCRAVWDTLNSMMTHDEATGLANVPTVGDIKKHAEEQGWNVNNASIEYYQWRKFHGISGRGKKQI